MGRSFVALMIILAMVSCTKAPPPPVAKLPLPKIDPWVLEWTDPTNKEPVWLSNGLYGYRINRFGQAITQYSANGYEAQGEERLIPTDLKPPAEPTEVSDYRQTLDMKTGELMTSWVQPNDQTTVTSIVDKAGRLISKISHTNPEILELKTIGGDPSQVELTTAFDEAKGACEKEWTTDIILNGPVADQQAIRSFIFYLRRAVHPQGAMSVAPYALSNKTYNGHIFWDADLWVFPALALLEPARARIIPDYRIRMLPQAKRNFAKWVASGRPTGGEPLGVTAVSPGAKFPWESSVSGGETIKGDSQFEDHVSGGVAWLVNLSNALGMTDNNQVLPAVAEFYRSRSVPGPLGREIKGTLSPDEFHMGSNDLYTNLLAQWTMNGGKWDGPFKFKLPRDHKKFLTYDGDKQRAYKQAAAVLSIYPLQFPDAVAQSHQMIERFGSKVTPNGPAMSDSIHALISARNGDRDLAYETWHRSWQPFTDQPLMLFSEKKGKASTYFVTGAAGSLQAVIYGFLNFRIGPDKPTKGWVQPLKNGYWLSSTPRLPKAWKSVTVKGMSILGKRYSFEFDSAGITQKP